MLKRIPALIFYLLFTFSCFGQDVRINRSPQPHKLLGLWSADINITGQLIAIGGDDRQINISFKGSNLFSRNFRVQSVVRQLRWHPTDPRLLAIATDNAVILINAETSTLYQMPGGALTVAWHYNGELLATAGNDGLIHIWDIVAGKLIKTFTKNTSGYSSLDWHPSKDILAAAGDDIHLLDTAGTTLKVIKHRKENARVTSVRWHPSGDFFASADQGDPKAGISSLIQLWGDDGELLITMPGTKAGYQGIAWDKEGNSLASVSDALRIWSSIGRLLYTGKSPDQLWGVDWDHVSGEIITSSKRGRVRLWDAEAKLLNETLH